MSQDIRKLVTIRPITKIEPINGADAIEAAYIGGWASVIKKNQFTVGDFVMFFEIDSFLPAGVEEFDFLMTRGTRKVIDGHGCEVEGTVLKTMKLRGQVSQGLILPVSFGLTADSTQEEINEKMDEIGVFKYEKPLPASGLEIADFPSLIKKTDSERVQNVSEEFLQSLDASEWIATEKIDGTSSTFWKTEDGVLHAASRNWEITLEGDHPHARIAKMYKLDEIIPVNGVIQAEIFGEGIQGNPLKMNGLHLAVFSNAFLKPTAISSEIANFEEKLAKKIEESTGVNSIHPDFSGTAVEDILSETNGVIAYNEQIISILTHVVQLELTEVDNIRKSMVKDSIDILNEFKPVFFNNALQKDFSEVAIESLWNSCIEASKAALPKSHVVTYSMIAIRNFENWVAENLAPKVDLPFPKTVAEAVAQVDGMKSSFNKNVQAEGVVWHNINGKTFLEIGDRPNFKAINNKFLLKNGG